MNGDLIALLAATFWACANVTIARGSGGKGDENGAFLSILLTVGLAAVIWLAQGVYRGWSQLNTTGMLWFALSGALTIFIGRVFLHSSLQYLGAVRATSVKRLSPLFTVVFGVTLLGDHLDAGLIFGMLLIFSGFAVLLYESHMALKSGVSVSRIDDRSGLGRWVNLGIVYGVVSALAYSVGNIARKVGMTHLPDAALGTMFGAAVGTVLFVLTALGVQSYRNAVIATFTRFNPWLMAAGVLASFGQLMYFLALDLNPVSRVALIASIEVFLTILLMVVVFPKREKLTGAALAAAAFGVAGTIVIITARM